MRWAWWLYGEAWFWWNIRLDGADRLGFSFLGWVSLLSMGGYALSYLSRDEIRMVIGALSIIGVVGSLWDAALKRKAALGRPR